MNATLAEVADKLEREFDLIAKKAWSISKRRSHKKACLGLVVKNYGEVLLILRRLLTFQSRLKELHAQLLAGLISNTPSTHASTSPQTTAQSVERIQVIEFIVLDIKSLYIWCYHILEVFRACQINIDLSELHRISLLRNAFITHVVDQPLFQTSITTQSGIVFDRECENIRIRFHAPLSQDKQFAGLKRIVTGAKPYIPELKTENNWYEQLRLIYENLGKLPDTDLRKKAEQLIRKLGTASEPPAQIGLVLLKALRDYKKTKSI